MYAKDSIMFYLVYIIILFWYIFHTFHMSLVSFCVGLGTSTSSLQGLARTLSTCAIKGKPMWKGPLPNWLVIYTVAGFLCCEIVTNHPVGFRLGLGNDDSNVLVLIVCRSRFGGSHPIRELCSKRWLCKLLWLCNG